jgi:hypothetical protein
LAGAQSARPANFGISSKLSETGLFESTQALRPHAGVVSYSINAEQWQDGALAERLIACPARRRSGQ